MHHALSRKLLLTLIIGLTTEIDAALLFRCEAANGHLTFSQHGCPPEQIQSQQEVHNPTPGGGKPIPLARPSQPPRNSHRSGARQDTAAALTVVGEKQDGCGNLLSDSERRTAIIQGRIRTGMTRADVESAFGKPDSISQSNSQVRYQYKAKPGQGSRSVSFDEFGCVRGKASKAKRGSR